MVGQEEDTNVSANKVSTAKLEIFHSTGALLKVKINFSGLTAKNILSTTKELIRLALTD